MINKVTLLGNLTRDAETVTGSQTTVTRMRLATHTNWLDGAGEWQRRAEFHSLVAFGELAERCSGSCTKGRRIYVEGHLRTRDWTGPDGLRRFSTEVVADHVRYLDAQDLGGSADVGGLGEDAEDGATAEAHSAAMAPVTAARTTRARGLRAVSNDTPAEAGEARSEDVAAAV
jgi:single-strand DNA-binding protein